MFATWGLDRISPEFLGGDAVCEDPATRARHHVGMAGRDS